MSLDFEGWRGAYTEDLGHQQMFFCCHCFLMGKTFFLFLFCREEANGEEDNKTVENRRETGQSKLLEDIGEVAVQLTDQPLVRRDSPSKHHNERERLMLTQTNVYMGAVTVCLFLGRY